MDYQNLVVSERKLEFLLSGT